MSNRTDISIRLAGPDDVDTICNMIHGLAAVTNDRDRVSSTPQDFQKYGFEGNRLFETLIAEKNGKPIGLSLYFYSFSTWLGEPGIYVQDLYVVEEERGTGLGQRLLEETARQGRARNATHLRLSVEQENTRAQQFYEHLAMHHRKDELTYHIGGTEFLEMAEA